MCVILYKPMGVDLPNVFDILPPCWEANPDGAGIAWRTEPEASPSYAKGLMSFGQLIEALFDMGPSTVPFQALELVVHFRIGTSGGINPRMTHPHTTDTAMAAYNTPAPLLFHNGVLGAGTRTMSDTAIFMRKLARTPSYSHMVLELCKHSNTQKFVLMQRGHATTLVGRWTELDGVLYSNLYWIEPPSLRACACEKGNSILFECDAERYTDCPNL